MGNKSGSEAQEDGEPAQATYYQMAQEGYEQLVNAIIRPPRSQYLVAHLGPKNFRFCNRDICRHDFNLMNERNQQIRCSIWEHAERKVPAVPCVIYLHGNSSSRIEALAQLSLILRMGCSFLAFDTSGSGMSDGEYVSLGYYEREDLRIVISHLREEGRTSTIALWGRSMGAATSLLHGERDPSIAGMILDSPFSDLRALAEDMVEKGRQQGMFAPGLLVSLVLRWIRQSVQKKAEFDINDISPIKHADKCFIPALFIAGKDDDFINPSHSQKLHDLYAGDKNIILVEGGHNSYRPAFMFDSVQIFLSTALMLPQNWLQDDNSMDDLPRGVPPWELQSRRSSWSLSSLTQRDGVFSYNTVKKVADGRESLVEGQISLGDKKNSNSPPLRHSANVQDVLPGFYGGNSIEASGVPSPPSSSSSSSYATTSSTTSPRSNYQSPSGLTINDALTDEELTIFMDTLNVQEQQKQQLQQQKQKKPLKQQQQQQQQQTALDEMGRGGMSDERASELQGAVLSIFGGGGAASTSTKTIRTGTNSMPLPEPPKTNTAANGHVSPHLPPAGTVTGTVKEDMVSFSCSACTFKNEVSKASKVWRCAVCETDNTKDK